MIDPDELADSPEEVEIIEAMDQVPFSRCIDNATDILQLLMYSFLEGNLDTKMAKFHTLVQEVTRKIAIEELAKVRSRSLRDDERARMFKELTQD